MKAWLSDAAKVVEIDGDTLTDGGMAFDVTIPPVRELNEVYDFPNNPLPWFTVAGQRYLLYPESKYKPADPDAEELPIYVQASATVEGGVSVWQICECDYVAGYDRESVIAWYVKETGVEADEIDFEAEPEDLERLVGSEDGDWQTFREGIREQVRGVLEIPYVAASTEV